MKITVEIPESDVKEILCSTGENNKGRPFASLVADALMLKCRGILANKFIDGEWGVELKGFENSL